MRKRNIKSIYHWSIMFLTMGMPLLITACSYLPNAYNENNVIEYQTKKQVDDIVVGHRYTWSNDSFIPKGNTGSLYFDELSNLVVDSGNQNTRGYGYYINVNSSSNTYYLSLGDDLSYSNFKGSFDFTLTRIEGDITLFLKYISEETTEQVVNNGAYQVYQFNTWFSSLGVNSWYNSVLDGFGMLPSSYTPLANVLYLPLYGLWVLMFDLVFDTLALVPTLFHNLLDKVKGETE